MAAKDPHGRVLVLALRAPEPLAGDLKQIVFSRPGETLFGLPKEERPLSRGDAVERELMSHVRGHLRRAAGIAPPLEPILEAFEERPREWSHAGRRGA